MRNEFDIEFATGLTAKKSPDFEEIVHKTVAGISEKDLIERNTIGEVRDSEDDEDGESETKDKTNV